MDEAEITNIFTAEMTPRADTCTPRSRAISEKSGGNSPITALSRDASAIKTVIVNIVLKPAFSEFITYLFAKQNNYAKQIY
jgi:hypothetical protein